MKYPASMKFPVKAGILTLDKEMTLAQAKRYGERTMPKDLRRSGFQVFAGICDLYPDLGTWIRISYGKKV